MRDHILLSQYLAENDCTQNELCKVLGLSKSRISQAKILSNFYLIKTDGQVCGYYVLKTIGKRRIKKAPTARTVEARTSTNPSL